MRKYPLHLAAAVAVALAGLAFVSLPSDPETSAPAIRPASVAPADFERKPDPTFKERAWTETTFDEGIENKPIRLRDVPAIDRANKALIERIPGRQPEMPISKEKAEQLRQAAAKLPYDPKIQEISEAAVELTGTVTNVVVNAIDASQSCSGCSTVPPDPEMAVGPSHIIVVTNVAFAIYNKSTGALLSGPTYFDSFFSGVTGCTGTFDPNVLYDESADRFILGIDGNGLRYCVAASQTGNPTGSWNRYSFSTVAKRRDFFDYPHAGVGRDAIYMGANIFRGQNFFEGRVWAMNKTQMYAGSALTVSSKTTGADSTPQPANLHGWNQGTWPVSGPEYILTDDLFNGATYGVFSWTNPFGGGGGTLTKTGVVNLNTATGITAGFPIAATQQGGSNLQANDWRVQDADYRNGFLWMTNTIACNPGGGTVNCARWAQINPATLTVAQAGVFASSGTHRTFADIAANDCDDAVVGYTKTSSSMNPAVWVTGRQGGDPAGTLQAEVVCRNGDGVYTSFDAAPHRWGDYTEVTPDPNGVDLWYVGEFSKPTQANPGFTSTRWGTTVCKISFACTP